MTTNKELLDRINAVENRATSAEGLVKKLSDRIYVIEQSQETIELNLNTVDNFIERLNGGELNLDHDMSPVLEEGLSKIVKSLDAILAHGIGLVQTQGTRGPPQQERQVNPFNTNRVPDLDAVQWKEGTYGPYCFSNDNPELADYLHANPEGIKWGEYTVKLGRNTKYINAQKPKRGGGGGGSYRGGGGGGKPASPKQIALLKKLNVAIPNGLTSKQASDLITENKNW